MFTKVKATEQQAVGVVRPATQAAYTSLSASGQWHGSGTKLSQALSPRQRETVFFRCYRWAFLMLGTQSNHGINSLIERDGDLQTPEFHTSGR